MGQRKKKTPPESIIANNFSCAVLISGSMCASLQISSNSDLLFRTSSFILLAFNFFSLLTSASVCQKYKMHILVCHSAKRQVGYTYQTFSIVSSDRTPDSVISDAPRASVTLSNWLLSSWDESIRFHSSNRLSTVPRNYRTWICQG